MIASLSLFLLASMPPCASSLSPHGSSALTFEEPPPAARLEALLAEYRRERKVWVEELMSAAPERQAEIAARIPDPAYWPRFRALADEGMLAAWQWLADHARDSGQPVVDVCRQAFEAAGSSQPVVVSACQTLEYCTASEREDAIEVLSGALATVSDTSSQNLVALTMGILMARSADEAKRAEGLELLRTLAAEHPGQDIGKRASNEVFRQENLSPGALAPDFEGKTIDGVPLKLSSLRGKIVLLDFFGFW